MSFLMKSCGLPDDHDPHWVQQPPIGGVGGARCEGHGEGESEVMAEWKEWLNEHRPWST